MADLAPTRSRTDPLAAEKHQSDHPLLPRRLHASSFRSKGQYISGSHHHHRQHAKDKVQSAIDLKPPITFEHVLRRDKKSPDTSRRGSSTPQQPQLDGGASMRQSSALQKTVRPEDVARAKKENEKREEQLRESLKSVEEVGMSSTRQLDDTYYSILEKASILRSTVASLQQLAAESRKMHANFQEDINKLENDTKQNMDSYNNFEQQEKTINDLVTKLQESRTRTNNINDRLESARLRVQGFEERENAKQAKRRIRWNIMWMSLVGILVLVVAIVLAKKRRAVGHQLHTVGEQLVKLGDIAEDVMSPLSAKLRPSPTEDPYLRRLFDQL